MLKFENNYLIAEIGINHNGNFGTAEDLIFAAKNSGCDAIKFQYRNLSRAYSGVRLEIGDEILSKEIEKNFISVREINKLAEYAKSYKLDVGISFFDSLDISDFEENLHNFDFFKVPSVELTNLSLIHELLALRKFVYISTGASTELEIEGVFGSLPKSGWMPLHCVSNYPTQILNAKIGYIEHLRDRWNHPVGYSSHDEFWEVCLLAISKGATVIERHITLDKSQLGLDHSTSSTPEEFFRLSSILKNHQNIMGGFGPRYPNQGELINRQNLGKSYFAKHDLPSGISFHPEDFEYRHPRVGLSLHEATQLLGSKTRVQLKQGSALTPTHFSGFAKVPERVIEICNDKSVSLPIRLHDYAEIYERFPLNNFELHLSFGEVESLRDFVPLSDKHRVTIHFPDYISPSALFDPFSIDRDVKHDSLKMIEKISQLVERLSDLSGQRVTTVSSLSRSGIGKEQFYNKCSELQSRLNSGAYQFTYQWLPPFAWYFGGTEKLNHFNSPEDIDFILAHQLGVTLDTSHFLMSANYFNFNAMELFSKLEPQVQHFHLADAKSFDGEGFQVGSGDSDNLPLLLKVMGSSLPKVVEVWQGHLNLYQGFQDALVNLARIYDEY